MTRFDELWGRSTPNSWARVPRGPLAAAVGGWIFGATATAFTVAGTAITWGTIGGFLITTAITSWAMSALVPKQDMKTGQQGILSNRREAVGAFDIIYGEVRKGGTITFMETNGQDNKFMHFILTLAGHEVDSINNIYINDEVVTLNSSGFVTGDTWKSKIRIKKYLGTATQTVDPDLLAVAREYATMNNTTPSINENFRGRGIAYLYVRLEYDQEVFADGIPTITAVVRGKKVWDPRRSGFYWTDNAALCIRDYVTEAYGLNSKQVQYSVNSPSWTIGANVSDMLVTKKDGTSEKRYTINGVVSTANSPRSNLQDMLASCGGTLFWGEGRWQFKAGYYPDGPYTNFDMNDLRSGITMNTKNSRKENFNEVAGVFVDANQDWIEADFPRVKSNVFLQRDNNQENVLDMALPFTTSPITAQRLAKMALFRSREEITISADFSLKAAKHNVGDVITFTFPRYGFNAKPFEIVSWKLVPAQNGELKVNMVLKETSRAAYDWNAEESDILRNNTRLPKPGAGLAISNLNVTNRQTLQSDGSLLGEVVLAWDAPRSAFVDRYNVQWKRTTDSRWSATDTTETEIILPSIQSGVPYQFRVRAVSVGGFLGAWETVGATLGGKSTPPGVPTNFQVTDIYRGVSLTWTNPTDKDLNRVEIFANTTNSATGRVKVGEVNGNKFIFNMEPRERRWFWLRAVDHSSNVSAFTASRQGTALFIARSDVTLDVQELLDEAGMSGVEVLPTLPTTGNKVGRTVYNTTDRELYTWNGTAWEKAVNTDIEGKLLSLPNFPASLRPVEFVSTLPTTGNFQGRVVFLSTDNKVYRWTGTAWTAAVPTTDLSGTLTAGQVGNLAIGTQHLQNLAVNADKIAANAITEVKLGNLSISNRTIADLAINSAKLANNAVTEVKINENAVSARVLANLAVNANHIADNTVTEVKIAPGSVSARVIADLAVSAEKLADNSVTFSKFAVADATSLLPNSDFSGDGWLISNFSSVEIVPGTATDPLSQFVRLGGSSSIARNISARGFFPIAPGDSYVMEFYARASEDAENATITTSYRWGATNPGTGVTSGGNQTIGSSIPITTTWEKYTRDFTPSSNRNFIRPYIRPNHSTGTIDVTGFRVYKRIGTNLIEPGAVDITKFASGLRPVEVVDSLPTSGNSNGRVVTLTTDGKLYRYHSGSWTSAIPSADIIGQLTNTQLAAIDAAKVSGQLTDAQIAAISAAKVSGQLTDSQIEALSAAKIGGQLTNDQIAAIATAKLIGTISSAQIADAAVTTAKFASGLRPVEVVSSLPTTGNVAGRTVVLTTDGKLYRYHGNSWTSAVPAADLSGSVTSAQIESIVASKLTGQLTNDQLAAIAANKITGQIVGTQITDNSITTAKIAANAVTANEILANTITGDKLISNTINTRELAASAITANEIASNAVTAIKILAGSITGDKMVANAITTRELSANSVTAGQIATNAITAGAIAAGAITSVKISANAVTAREIAAGTIVADNIASNAITTVKIATNAVTANEIASSTILAGNIASNAITTAKIAANAVTANEIAAGTIVADNIASNAITTVKIAANTITAAQIAAGAVTANEIASNAITTVKLAAGAVTANEIVSNAITSDKIAANAITAAKIAAGAITATEIAAGAITAGKLRVSDFTNLILNPDFSDGTLDGWANVDSGITVIQRNTSGNSVRTAPTGNFLRIPIDGNQYQAWAASNIPVKPGDQFTPSFDYAGGGTGLSAVAQIRVLFRGADGAQVGSVFVRQATVNSTNWRTLQGAPIVAPEGSDYISSVSLRLNSGGTGGAFFATNFRFERMTSGELIVDGAISAIKISAGAVEADKIATNAITADKINANAVQAGKINSNAVTSREIAASTIIAGNIASNAITTAKIAANAVTAIEIAAGTILAENIASNAITTVKIATGAVTANEVAAGTITATEIASNAITTIKLAATSVVADKIATNAVVADKINANAVTTAKIATNAVTANEIAAGTITATEIASNAVTSVKVNANAITTRELAVETIVAGNIASNAITTAKIATGAITAAKVAAGAIAAEHLQSNAITASKIAVTNFVNQILNNDLNDTDGWTLDPTVLHHARSIGGSTASGVFEFLPGQSTTRMVRWGTLGNGRISVSPGEVYSIGASFRPSGGTPKFSAVIAVWYYRADGSQIAYRDTTRVNTNTSYNREQWTQVVPSEATYMQVAFGRRDGQDSSANGAGYLELPFMRRVNDGELIVDGAITANKVSANSISAREIVANSITAGLIQAGAIQAVAIQAGAVTADKINVNTLSAISADLGSITGGSININGNFIVNSSGRVAIRSGTSGERLVITNDQINVFDNSGTLRVRIGRL